MIGEHSVLELRQYTTYAGRRDELMRLFRRKFLVPQNELGAWVLGTYRDLDDPDRFVWLRGFKDMPSRQTSLERFYGGSVWLKYRADANATIADSDNVLLLRPLQRLRSGSLGRPGVLRISIQYLSSAPQAGYAAFFAARLQPLLQDCGARLAGIYQTEPAANNFRLPVREGEGVFLWLSEFQDERSERDFTATFNARSGWRDGAPEELLPAFMRKPEVLRLAG